MRDPAQTAARLAEPLGRGDFVRTAFRLGASQATGILTAFLDDGNAEVLVLRRGRLVPRRADRSMRHTRLRLERVASAGRLAHFDGGVAAYPPGAAGHDLCLATWAREHLEAQLDQRGAEELVRELAGVRLVVDLDRAPPSRLLDDCDRRILDAMREPRRLDQIWPLARTPRFRLLTFLHLLRALGAIAEHGVASDAEEHAPRQRALRALGVTGSADRASVKRAYRRLARALHPDLHPHVAPDRRRDLERKLAEINDAYRALLGDALA